VGRGGQRGLSPKGGQGGVTHLFFTGFNANLAEKPEKTWERKKKSDSQQKRGGGKKSGGKE